jgi:hypothetical protein
MIEAIKIGAVKFLQEREVVTRQIQDEEVLLQLDSGRYFGLDEIGSRTWDLLIRKQNTIVEAAQILAEEYDAPLGQIEDDLVRLVEELKEARLVRFQ